jgi:hypothetical protein
VAVALVAVAETDHPLGLSNDIIWSSNVKLNNPTHRNKHKHAQSAFCRWA